jgi:hypothetical protein
MKFREISIQYVVKIGRTSAIISRIRALGGMLAHSATANCPYRYRIATFGTNASKSWVSSTAQRDGHETEQPPFARSAS